MFEKRVSQSERRIRNSHVTSMRTGTPLGSNSNCQVYTLALESAHTPKAHDNRSELRNKRHRADSAMPRNPAKDSRPSFGRAHVRVWERDYVPTRNSSLAPGQILAPRVCTLVHDLLVHTLHRI